MSCKEAIMQQPSRKLRKIFLGFDQHLYFQKSWFWAKIDYKFFFFFLNWKSRHFHLGISIGKTLVLTSKDYNHSFLYDFLLIHPEVSIGLKLDVLIKFPALVLQDSSTKFSEKFSGRYLFHSFSNKVAELQSTEYNQLLTNF